MSLEGPELRYTRSEDRVARALRLAREIEGLLEEAPQSAPPGSARSSSSRMASAVAASLVSELEALAAGAKTPARTA